MKRLNITNFTQRMDEMYSDYFEIKYSTQDKDKYIIGIVTNDVVSFKPSPDYNYMMAIYKGRGLEDMEDSYGIKLWDMGKNITCLLYTSPSPRDLSTSRMPSSA